MKTLITVVLALTTGCVYSPRNNRYYNNDETKQQKPIQRINAPIAPPNNPAPYVQYEQNDANEQMSRPQMYYPRISPFYTTMPHPVNRTVYFVETRY